MLRVPNLTNEDMNAIGDRYLKCISCRVGSAACKFLRTDFFKPQYKTQASKIKDCKVTSAYERWELLIAAYRKITDQTSSISRDIRSHLQRAFGEYPGGVLKEHARLIDVKVPTSQVASYYEKKLEERQLRLESIVAQAG